MNREAILSAYSCPQTCPQCEGRNLLPASKPLILVVGAGGLEPFAPLIKSRRHPPRREIADPGGPADCVSSEGLAGNASLNAGVEHEIGEP